MKKILLFVTVIGSFLAGCSKPEVPVIEEPEILDKATQVIHEAIRVSGGEKYDSMQVRFDFRDRSYTAMHNHGMYEYVRITQDSLGEIRDVLNNDGYYRTINGERVEVIDSMAGKYARSVNSVIYFALLPDALADDAVISDYIGLKEIKGNIYHKISITFEKQGGGDDFEDEFIYWFDTTNYDMDYMAYLYFTDGGGMRFRQALNKRKVNGIRFQDYNNYKPREEISLDSIDDAFLDGKLDVLSRIETDNIEVSPFDSEVQ